MSDFIIKDVTVLDIKTKEDTRNWLGGLQGIDLNGWKPILIRTNFDSFFQCLEDEANKETGAKICKDSDKKLVIKNIRNAKKKIENSNAFNFLENSSIWIRLCNNENWDGVEGSSSQPISVKNALDEFNWFTNLGLYDFNSAKEFIDYNVRAQSQNYLKEIGGHGEHVTPVIYSDEVECRDFFLDLRDESTPNNNFFKFLKKEVEHCKDFKTENVALRILVVDDKIGKVNADSSQKVILNCHEEENKDGKWRCKECVYPNNNNEPCKLQVIKKLLSGDFISKDKTNTTRGKYNRKTYWSDEIRSYCVNTLTIKELWQTENENAQKGKKKSILKLIEDKVKQINKDLELVIKKDQDEKELPYAQIIGVRDLESALALMSCCKFDVILLDYLLGKRSDTDDERYYSAELFEFLSYDFGKPEIDDPDVIKMLRKNNKTDKEDLPRHLLEQFRDEVKLNRGPLDKYWIVPMTSYNSSLLSDLQRRNVRLIDHRWNISQGADPINTPWRFLYKLNEFVDLQLRSSVYWKKQLMTFVRYTCEDFKTRFEKISKERAFCFEEFQQFMGAEYANYMKRYGARKLIERDAALEGDNSNKSLFATYIARNFYNDPKFSIETELNRLMQSFYHQAATMFNDRYGLQRLRIAFEQMRMFIVYNKLEKESESPKELLSGLCFLYAVIDSEFECDKIKDWLNNSMNRRGSDV